MSIKKKIKKSKYDIWITYNNAKQRLRLPVLPEKIKIKYSGKSQSIDIAELGEILIPQKRDAIEISFESFFPATYFSGCKYKNIPKPNTAVKKLKKWLNCKKPIHFTYNGAKLSMYCLIKDFTVTEQGGDPGTMYFSITFKEYREPKVRKIKVNGNKANVSGGGKRPDNSENPDTYTVQSGDCLWNLAIKYYGSGSEYTKIYEANKSVIGGNPNNLTVGQVLKIP